MQANQETRDEWQHSHSVEQAKRFWLVIAHCIVVLRMTGAETLYEQNGHALLVKLERRLRSSTSISEELMVTFAEARRLCSGRLQSRCFGSSDKAGLLRTVTRKLSVGDERFGVGIDADSLSIRRSWEI